MKAPWIPPKGDNFKYNITAFPGDNHPALEEAEIMIRKDSV
jgi:hypothetical protein